MYIDLSPETDKPVYWNLYMRLFIPCFVIDGLSNHIFLKLKFRMNSQTPVLSGTIGIGLCCLIYLFVYFIYLFFTFLGAGQESNLVFLMINIKIWGRN